MQTRSSVGWIHGIAALLCGLAGSAAVQAMPAIQHWQTENGAQVYYVPAPELPIVNVRVVLQAGSVRDGEVPGLAQMTGLLLDMGADGMSANDIAEQLESLGAELDTGALRDMAWVSLRSLSDAGHLDPAVEVMARVLGKPDFNQRDLERERQRSLVALRRSDQQPSKIAGYRFFEAVYGEHPYATRPIGNADSLKAMTRKQIRAFYQQYYVARNAVIAIVGDLERKAAEQLAAKLAGAMAAGERAAAVPPVAALEAAIDEYIAHPSTQTHVRMGAPGMRRGDPDYFPLYVGNHILGGGGLVSRLFREVREDRGLSYSVNSYFSPMAQDGPYIFSLQTRNDQTDEALQVMRATLMDFHDNGPTEAELVASKKNITGGFPLRIDSNSKIVEYLALIGFYDLPLDYLDTFNGKVMAVTREQISDAYQRRVPLGRMATIIVGGDQSP
ncbi:MAG: pitrilysin family protein [Pseudomonadota bacterium]